MRSKRTRVAEGVYRDRFGLSATVKIGRVQREKRFPPTTDLREVEYWRIQTRAALAAEQRAGTIQSFGTLEHDGTKFLTRKKGQAGFKADRSHLRAWFGPFGSRLRSAITKADVEHQMAAWREAGVSARTLRHRIRLLRECYKALDGPQARTPVDDIVQPRIPPARPVAVPIATIRKVAAKLQAAGLMKDYARFLVRATTGQRPAQIMRTTPDDVDVKRRIWYVRSAKGGQPTPLPLNAEMLAAWKKFKQADAWGPFDTAIAAETLRAHGWPKDIRPYALRHTFAIDLLLSGVELGDVQGLLGHTQIQTTRNHYAPILIARLRSAVNGRRLKL